jgi:ubiquinone/menaquinone biosynthesis C-methylase UbiE
MNLKERSSEPELMDYEGDEEEIRSALKELKIINKLLGGNRITAGILQKISKQTELKALKLLDAGSGASDILTQKKFSFRPDIVSIDKNFFICKVAQENKEIDKVVCGDALRLPFKDNSFDVVHASLFIHHFSNDQLNLLLKGFCRISGHAVVINDLRRSYFAYYGFALISTLFSGNRLVKYDGLVSIRRGFKKDELTRVLNDLGYQFKIKSKWGFRWLLVIYCNERI